MATLTNVLPANSRKIVYTVYSLVGLCIGGVQAGFSALDNSTPDWLKVTLSVYAFVGTAVGATAASNVDTRAPGDVPA